MNRDLLDIAVFGATGLAGSQALASLGESNLRLGNVRAFGGARRAPSVDSAEFGSRSIPVEPVARHADLAAHVAVLCVPQKVAALLAPALQKRGVFVVDVGGRAGLDAPLWIPGQELPAAALAAKALRTPSPAGWLVATTVNALDGCTGVRGTVNLPAGALGRAAMDELGQQVLTTYTHADPPRVEFPEGLAFDTLPQDAEEEEWSDAELRLADEVSALTGLAADAVNVTLCTQPLFSGMTAALQFEGVDLDAARSAFEVAPGLTTVTRRERLRPRAFATKTGVGWGRLRADRAGAGVHGWFVGDNLSGAAGEVVVGALRAFARSSLMGNDA